MYCANNEGGESVIYRNKNDEAAAFEAENVPWLKAAHDWQYDVYNSI